MKHRITKFSYRLAGLLSILLSVWAVGGLLLGVQSASAVDSGPTTTGDVCMQKLFGFPVTNSNRLNCTAEDIKIAKATAVDPSSCTEGETFDLTATFQVDVTSNERYDAGFFFNIAGGANARLGTCSLSILDKTVGPALDLDGDTCGDLNAGTYEITFTIPGVLCHDSDGDGFLNLPNCTSWHSNRSTACNVATDADPETKSKCKCDDTFQVPVIVESPSGAVTKKATQAVVTYEVTVKNNSSSIDVTLTALVDSVYGNIADANNSLIESTTCATGGTIAKGGGTYTCEFTVQYDYPGTAGNHQNTVTATLRNPARPQDDTNVQGSTTINVNLNVGP
jgi:hypothetical protein